MKLSRPRIDPLSDEQATDEQRELLATAARGRPPLNVQRTIAQYPELARARQAFTNHVMRETSLPARERELLILRTGWNCQSEYEFAQHSRFGRAVGLSDDKIRRVVEGPDAAGWDSVRTRHCCGPPTSCMTDAFISDATWAQLAERYSTKQLMDVVFAVGQYHIVSMALNSFGVQFEPDTTDRFPS